MAWYHGTDKANAQLLPGHLDVLGLYDKSAENKAFHLHDCITGNGVRIVNNEFTDEGSTPSFPKGAPHDLPTYYNLLRDTPCYGPQ